MRVVKSISLDIYAEHPRSGARLAGSKYIMLTAGSLGNPRDIPSQRQWVNAVKERIDSMLSAEPPLTNMNIEVEYGEDARA